MVCAGLRGVDLQGVLKAQDRFVISRLVEMNQRAGVDRFAIARVDLECPIEAQDRLIVALQLAQHLAKLVPVLGEIRLEQQRPIETLGRLLIAALVLESRSEIGKIVRDIRILPDSLGEPFDGEMVLLGGEAQQPHQMQGVRVGRVERERLPSVLLSLCELPGLQKAKPGLEERSRRPAARSNRGHSGLFGGSSSLVTVHRRRSVAMRSSVDDSRIAAKLGQRTKGATPAHAVRLGTGSTGRESSPPKRRSRRWKVASATARQSASNSGHIRSVK